MPASASDWRFAVSDARSTALPCHHHRVHGFISRMSAWAGQVRPSRGWTPSPTTAASAATAATYLGSIRLTRFLAGGPGDQEQFGFLKNKSPDLLDLLRVFRRRKRLPPRGSRGRR